jgi:hypothetical protein
MSPSRSRLGFHYFPDDRHFTRSEAEAWLPVLTGLEASWLILRAGAEKAVPESFLRSVIDSGMEPVIHLPARVGSVGEAELAPLFASYAHWGLRYVVVFDRPNARASWESSEWSRGGLVERFLDRALPVWRLAEASGLAPVLPPLEPGGDYWDTAFLEAALSSLVRRGEQGLLEHLILGLYAWTYDQPLTWGAGGPPAWPETRPYLTPPGSQDQRGFRIFDWYSAIASKVLEHELPMLVMAGGATPPRGRSGLLGDSYGSQNSEIVRLTLSEAVPASVIAFAFYCLSTDDTSADAHAAWFTAPDAPRPWVEAVRRSIRTAAKSAPPRQSRGIAHYWLLPPGNEPGLAKVWEALLPQVADSHPTIGFSVREARSADRVTLVGNDDQHSVALEKDLREAGCRVERLPVPELARTSEDEAHRKEPEGAFDD